MMAKESQKDTDLDSSRKALDVLNFSSVKY